jgi:CRP/FNR family transcriptional regulator
MNSEKQEIIQLVQRYFPQIVEPELQEEIATVGSLQSHEGGKILMDYGSYVQHVPLVIEGSIKVVREGEDGNELLLYFLGGGDTCSMSFSCCMTQKQSIIRTVTEEPTTFIAIPIKYVDEWMHKYQSWKNFVMTSYDNRIYELVQTIDSIAFKKMDDRLMEYLQKKAEIKGSSLIHSTHQDIAYDLNASREGISRLLKQLEKRGQVKLGRNKIELVQ